MQITKTFRFESAHRLLHHPGPCKFIHGHSYKAAITVESDTLDSLGMVADFAILKEKIGVFIEAELDHNLLLHPEDPMMDLMRDLPIGKEMLIFGGRHPFVMPERFPNPTAENIASMLFLRCLTLFTSQPFSIVSVQVWETDACSALCTGVR